MAVTFDANATADVTANGVTSITSSNLTVGSGSNRALVAQICLSLQTASAMTVNWDQLGTPQALTQIKTANATGTPGRADIWARAAPTSGALQLKAAWTGASDVVMNGVSWTGVDQTGGATSFPNATSAVGAAAPSSLTITSAVGDATMSAHTASTGSFSTPNQTQTFIDNTPATISTAGERAAGAATVTHTFTGASPWVVAGCSIKASAAGTLGLEWMQPLSQPTSHYRPDVESV